ncbi:MAG: peptide-methionine (R)-S-oxide reductase MsrB [Flavobacteriales bacterium]|nr:peptide-methionine (R)-S-oxide reductase MsrB [Flavobacteriales bacterium]
MKAITLSIILLSTLVACSQVNENIDQKTESNSKEQVENKYEIQKSPDEWQAELSDKEYYILREKGTEPAGTGDLLFNKKEGTYSCRGCGQGLFESDTKFESGTGWPSFYSSINGTVEEEVDRSFGMSRTEILCSRCGGHLGHVFSDGPEPTGLRYCVNSASLDFEETKK